MTAHESPMLTEAAVRRAARSTLHHGYESWEGRIKATIRGFLAAQDRDALYAIAEEELSALGLADTTNPARAVVDALLGGVA